MTTPPPYGSTPGEPPGYPHGSAPGAGYGQQGYAGPPSGAQQAFGQGYSQGYGQQAPYGQPGYGYSPPGYGVPSYGAPGYGAPGYGAPGYGAPGYGVPGYGVPGYGVSPLDRRPGLVTAAAVLAFIFGAWSVFQAFFGVVFASVANTVTSANGFSQAAINIICDNTSPSYDANSCNSARAGIQSGVQAIRASGFGTFAVLLAIGSAVVAILMIWGGAVALSGKNGQLLVIAAGIYMVLAIVLMIATTFGFFYIFGIVLPVLIAVFMLNPSSRAWVRLKGGKTF